MLFEMQIQNLLFFYKSLFLDFISGTKGPIIIYFLDFLGRTFRLGMGTCSGRRVLQPGPQLPTFPARDTTRSEETICQESSYDHRTQYQWWGEKSEYVFFLLTALVEFQTR